MLNSKAASVYKSKVGLAIKVILKRTLDSIKKVGRFQFNGFANG
jgi:hypothetical protein